MPRPVIADDPASSYDARPMAVEPRRAASQAGAPAPALARNLLIPSSIVLCFVLVYVVGVPAQWVIPVGAAFMAIYVVAPVVGRRSLARFDRDAVQLLARGERHALPARYRRAVGMRLFAAPALVAQRRGMIAAECGRPDAACEAFAEAVAGWGGDAPLAVRLGLAHASFALGDDDEAIRSYRSVLLESPGLPNVARNLAHALARQGRDLAEAERLVEDLILEAGDAPSPQLSLLRGLVHARRGQRGPARKIRRANADASGPEVEALRADLERALEAR